jgi:hypothetical protein
MRAGKDSLAAPLESEVGENEKDGMGGLLASFARATRTLRRCSLGLMARLGKSIAKQSEGWVGEKYLPVGERVRKLRAVGGQADHPLVKKMQASLEGSFRETTIARCAQ